MAESDGARASDGPPGGGSAGPRAEPRDPWAVAALAAALAVGLVVFVRLGRWSLWYDEALTWADAHGGASNYNRVGYWIVRRTVALFGGVPTEANLRLAPAVAGFLAVPLTYWCFRPLAGGRRAALAALVVAASPWHLYWSQNARFYTFVQAAVLVGAGLVVRALVRGGTVRAAAGLAVVVVASVVQLQALVVAVALVVATACVGWRGAGAARRREEVLVVVGAGAVGGLAASWWAVDVFRAYLRSKETSSLLEGPVHLALSTGWSVTPALAAALVVGAVVVLRRGDRWGSHALLVLVVGLLGVTGAALFGTASAQYVFALLPWIALVAAWPAGEPEARGLPGAAWAAVLVLPLLASDAVYLTERRGDRPRWREAIAHVEARRGEHDLVLALPAAVGEFYVTGGGTDLRSPRHVGLLDSFHPRAHARWARTARPMWIVLRTDYLATWPAAERAQLREFLRDECRLDRRFPVRAEGRDLDLEVWRRP